jgi:hypothetical protein
MKERALTLIGLSLAAVASACESTSTALIKDTTQKCTFQKNGKMFFIGDRECLSTLPQQVIDGYLVIDHEYSVFYKNLRDIKPVYDQNAAWAELSQTAYNDRRKITYIDRRKVFRIRFLGSISMMAGIYGPGEFHGGVLIDRVISMHEVL